MNGLALLGAASTCNAVSWNGKYWLASVEGDSVGGGQTQVYSNDGITWLASNNGDTLFSGTSQALALATVKTGGAGAGSGGSSLEGEIATLQATQFGIGQTLYSEYNNKTANIVYINNTDKPINVYIRILYRDSDNHYLRINNTPVAELFMNGQTYYPRGTLMGIVPPGASYEYYTTAATSGIHFRLHAWYELR